MSHSFFEAFTKSKAKAFMPKSLNLINLDGDDYGGSSPDDWFVFFGKQFILVVKDENEDEASTEN